MRRTTARFIRLSPRAEDAAQARGAELERAAEALGEVGVGAGVAAAGALRRARELGARGGVGVVREPALGTLEGGGSGGGRRRSCGPSLSDARPGL